MLKRRGKSGRQRFVSCVDVASDEVSTVDCGRVDVNSAE